MTRSAPLTVGVALGTIGLEGDAWLRAAALLATAPIDRLWIWDHLMGRGAPDRPVLEATTLAAAALAQNPNLHVGTLVLDVTKRHPALTAKIAATLDAIAPGDSRSASVLAVMLQSMMRWVCPTARWASASRR